MAKLDAYAGIGTRKTVGKTPGTEKAVKGQKKNAAGGYVFKLDPMATLRRFLILGTAGGTYYTSEKELTKDAAKVLFSLIEGGHGIAVVDEIVKISVDRRAPKPNPALFALAVCAAAEDEDVRKHALTNVSLVARTGTHLFTFVKYAEQFRGWGRGLRNAIARWYEGKSVDQLAYQMVKYRDREGWTHRDVLRQAHPRARGDVGKQSLFDWTCGRETLFDKIPLVGAFEAAKVIPTADLPKLIKDNPALTWEMLPSEALNDAKVWKALLKHGVPMTALIRQLPRLTRLGLCKPFSKTLDLIVAQLADGDRIRKAGVHPLAVLVALRTYSGGRSIQGSSTWTPEPAIVEALDDAFYLAFGNVEDSGKATMLALDVSASMAGQNIAGMPINAREASAAMAMVTARAEKKHMITAFSNGFVPLDISKKQRLDDVITRISRLPFEGTDCAIPMLYAMKQGLFVDTFIIITDNETWFGRVHPFQALAEYRKRINPTAKLVVVGMTATGFTIADPSDAGMLDVVGFDLATPQLISEFSQGKL